MQHHKASAKTSDPFILEPSWQAVLNDELQLPYMQELAAFVAQERAGLIPIYPKAELVFNALKMSPYQKVKVAIVGQDPYHGPGQAEGLCFSVPCGMPLPPSLKNIFKELKTDQGIELPLHGSLSSWAEQGVLLLNSTLTVRQGEPMSHHGRGWEQFTDAVIKILCKREEPVIFVLWGKLAQDKWQYLNINELVRHPVLMAAHPSPFSAFRGFFGCRHFSKINELLEKQGDSPIDWGLNK
ncbi:MAG: uracil-DNA glycosylase [Parachlamydiaceae bacterium]|nr:uracil-DNA glycosylase [Parachlamydiaceae bacterium]